MKSKTNRNFYLQNHEKKKVIYSKKIFPSYSLQKYRALSTFNKEIKKMVEHAVSPIPKKMILK